MQRARILVSSVLFTHQQAICGASLLPSSCPFALSTSKGHSSSSWPFRSLPLPITWEHTDTRTKLMQASPPPSRFTHFALPATSLEENWEPRRRRPDHLPLSWSLSNWYIPYLHGGGGGGGEQFIYPATMLCALKILPLHKKASGERGGGAQIAQREKKFSTLPLSIPLGERDADGAAPPSPILLR